MEKSPVINPKKVHKHIVINKPLLDGKEVTGNGDFASEIGSKLKSKIPNKGNDKFKYLPPAVVNSFSSLLHYVRKTFPEK